MIAGLVSYLAIHLPFWVADWARRRWGKGEGPDGVRVKRCEFWLAVCWGRVEAGGTGGAGQGSLAGVL